MAKSRKCNLNQ